MFSYLIRMLLPLFALGGCISASKNEDPLEGLTLRADKPIVYVSPLPDVTQIYIEGTDKDGNDFSRLGYRGYDFNHDGRLDMVEVLKADGTVESYIYDFNFLGKIDYISQSQTKLHIDSLPKGNQGSPSTPPIQAQQPAD